MKQIYNKLIAKPYITILVVQFLLIFYTFYKFFATPFRYMFLNYYDGLKNYFTFSEYLKQEKSSKGLFHFTQMNYPFGEYIFFTDNTPLFSVPLHFINNYFVDISAYTIPIHNYIFIFFWLVTPLVIYSVFKRIFINKPLFAILFSIAIYWIHPQILRVNAGHFNLTLSLILVLVIRYLFYVYDNRQNENKTVKIKLFIFPFLLLFLSGFIHLYYIPLSAFAIGVFVVFLFLIESIKSKTVYFKKPILSLAGTFMAGVLVYLIINQIDSYSSLRKSVAGGYGWIEWMLTPESVINAYGHFLFRPLFFLDSKMPDLYYESFSYLGGFSVIMLLVCTLIFVYLLLSKTKVLKISIKVFFSNSLYVSLLVMMVLSYATAAGNYVRLTLIPLGFDNIFSVFYFLTDKVDLITQFRCIARFSWASFWVVVIFCALAFNLLLNKIDNQNIKIVLLTIALIIMGLDAFSNMKMYKKQGHWNVFEQNLLAEKFEKLPAVDFNKYQALYTIPAVQVGSENYDYTIDDQKEWTEYWMQLVNYSGLPTFNCKMSRTAENQAKAQVDILKHAKVPALILNQVNEKPILVIYSADTEKNFELNITDYAKEAANEGSKIISKFKMDTLFKIDNIYYLEWDIKNEH